MTDQKKDQSDSSILQKPLENVQLNFSFTHDNSPPTRKPAIEILLPPHTTHIRIIANRPFKRIAMESLPKNFPISIIRRLNDMDIDHPNTFLRTSIFYPFKKKHGFLFENVKPVCDLSPKSNYSLPVIVDTEYVVPEFENLENDDKDSFIEPRRHVTTQFKALYSQQPRILVHNELLAVHKDKISFHDSIFNVIRHPIIRSNQHAHIVPFLRLEGYEAHIRRDEKAHEKQKGKRTYNLSFIDLKLYGHFLVVDLTQIFEGVFLDDLKSAFLRKKIVQKRRLSASGWQLSVAMPWILTLNEMDFRVKLSLVDTSGLHGNASFKEICDNTGVLLNVKDALDDWKSAMDEAYFAVPELFDQYAVEDLKGDEVLKNYDKDILKIYEDLGVLDWYTPPKLTIGSTVNALFEAKISQFLGLNAHLPKAQCKEFRKKFTLQGSADYLKTLIQNLSSGLNSGENKGVEVLY